MDLKLLGKIAWILDGGGFKQIAQLGSMRSMVKRGIKPQYVQVVSVGAANGSKMVEGDFTEDAVNETEDEWMFICREGPSYICHKLDMVGAIWPRTHPGYIFKDKGLRKLLERLDMRKIIASPIEFQVATRNRSRQNAHTLFSNHDERFVKDPEIFRDVLRASMSIPAIFPQVNIFGEFHGDGLTHSIASAIKAGCDTIFVLTINHGRFVANPENEEWWHQLMVPFNIVLDELNQKIFREDLSESPERPSDFKILDVSSATSQSLWERFTHGLTSFMASLSRGDDPNFVPHLIIPIVAEVPASLHALHFNKGDEGSFRIAIDKAYEQTNKIIDLLEK